MEVTRHSLLERQMALIQHYFQRLDDMNDMYAQGYEWAQEALRSFDQEWQQLQTQQQWAVGIAHKDRRAAQLVVSFTEHAKNLLSQIDTRDAAKWLDDARMWANADDIKLNYRLLLLSCQVRIQRRDMERVREHLQDIEGLVNTLDDDQLRLEIAGLNVEYYKELGQTPQQMEWAERALALAQRFENPEQLADAYHWLGFACIRAAQSTRADTYLQAALDLCKELGMRLKQGTVYNALAANCFYWGKYTDSVPYAEQALAIMREFGKRQQEHAILANLALFSTCSGDMEKSLYYGQQSLAAAVESGSRKVEVTALHSLLLASTYLGLVEETNLYIERTRAHIREASSDSRSLESGIVWSQWLLAHEQGDWAAACGYAEQMGKAAQEHENKRDVYMAACSYGNTLCELGDFDAAAVALGQSLEFSTAQFKNPQLRAGLAGLSYAQAQRGHLEEAQALFDKFYELLMQASLVQLDPPFMTAWNAYRAALILGDARIKDILKAFEELFEIYVSHLHDDRLRTSFLNQYSVQSLLAVRSRL